MARFHCDDCGDRGRLEYRIEQHWCPSCGSLDVRVAVTIAELVADDQRIEALRRFAVADEARQQVE